MTKFHRSVLQLLLVALPFLFATEALAAPAILSVSPNNGPMSGGTTVTITGSGFAGGDTVKFGTTTATSTVDSVTQITAVSPAHAAGTVDITVTAQGGGGTSPTHAGDQFTFVAAAPPSWPITAVTFPKGGGSLTCTPNSVADGGSTTCTARANSGFTFGNWITDRTLFDCTSELGTTCVIRNVDRPIKVTATFDQIWGYHFVTVTKTGNGAGNVTSSPAGIDCGPPPSCSASISADVISFTATAFTGSRLVGWTGCVPDIISGSNVCHHYGSFGDVRVSAEFRYVGSPQSLIEVQKLYVAYYGRPADPEGLAYWAGRMDSDGYSKVVNAFGTSDEFTRHYANLSNAQIVTKLYQQILGRDPDPLGLAYFVHMLDTQGSWLPSIAGDLMGGATGDDRSALLNKQTVADYYTQKAAAGCAYGGEQAGVDALKNVTANVATVVSAKNAIDAKCGF